jgi:MFS transporter, DHA2 family, multidrug resistance protein
MQEIAANGANAARIDAIAAGTAVGAAFVWRQRRSRTPMIDLALFRNRGFSGSVVLSLMAMFAVVGFAIFATQYLQSVRGMSPLTAALWSLVPMCGTGTAVPLSQLLVQRVDRAFVAAGGLLVAAAGYLVLAQLQAASPLWLLLLGASIYAGGAVTAMTIGSELIMGAVPPDRAGGAAAVAETASEFGGALGMAVLGSIGVAVYRSDLAASAPAHLPAGALLAARSTLGGALSVATDLPRRLGADLASASRVAFTHGLDTAALGAAIAMVIAAASCARFFKGVDVERETDLASAGPQTELATDPRTPVARLADADAGSDSRTSENLRGNGRVCPGA